MFKIHLRIAIATNIELWRSAPTSNLHWSPKTKTKKHQYLLGTILKTRPPHESPHGQKWRKRKTSSAKNPHNNPHRTYIRVIMETFSTRNPSFSSILGHTNPHKVAAFCRWSLRGMQKVCHYENRNFYFFLAFSFPFLLYLRVSQSVR